MSVQQVVLKTMEWAPLRDIEDVSPIGDDDSDCVKELYEVLKKHGKADRFGITLLHKHFDMSDDEVLLEHTDIKNRTLILRPAKINSEEVERSIQTSWQITADDNQAVRTACYRRCVRNIHGNHEMGPHYWAD